MVHGQAHMRKMGPPTPAMTTIPLQPGGLRGENASHNAEPSALENPNCMEAMCLHDTFSRDFWRSVTATDDINQFCHLQMPLENFQHSKIFKVINDRGYVWFSTSRQKSNLCQECSKIVKITTKSCQRMIDSKFTKQWRIAKLISRQKWQGIQCGCRKESNRKKSNGKKVTGKKVTGKEKK